MLQKVLFLVIACSAASAVAYDDHRSHSNRNDRQIRPEDLIPNDRIDDIEKRRDFSNSIQYGLIEGLFKVKKSGLPDCTEEGMTIFRSVGRLANRMEWHPEEATEADFLNLVQLWISLATRCNYMTSLEGIIVSRQIGDWMQDQGGFIGAILSPAWLIAEIFFNGLDDLYILLTAFNAWN